MPGPNQLSVKRDDVRVTEADLVEMHQGKRTREGLGENIRVGVQYIEAWLRGRGAVPIYNLMEDAATAEISRTQVWQWVHHHCQRDDGVPITIESVRAVTAEELAKLRAEVGDAAFAAGHYARAAELFLALTESERFETFLTLTAYREIA